MGGAPPSVVESSAHAAAPFDLRIQVVDAPQINAFALPGGQIVVYTGLLRKAARPEQVAGVIAHEMAHVTLRHGLRGIAKQVGVLVGVQVLTGDLSGLAAQVATAAISNAYSRDAEREADAEGARMLAAAGIDPVLIAAPNTPAPALERIAKLGRGYTYCVARAGVTGSGEGPRLAHGQLFAELAELGAAPPVLGFGISSADHVRAAAASGAAGVISGSALVERATVGPEAVRDTVAAMAAATGFAEMLP